MCQTVLVSYPTTQYCQMTCINCKDKCQIAKKLWQIADLIADQTNQSQRHSSFNHNNSDDDTSLS